MIVNPNEVLTNKNIALQLAQIYTILDAQGGTISGLETALITPPIIPPSSTVQAVNQMLNGTFSHSQNSWIDAPTANNGRYECYAFFSQIYAANQAMYKNSTVTGGSPNYTLKEASHTNYDADYSDWDWTTGAARFQGAATIDALLPGNNIEAGYTFYASFDIVRASQYVTCSAEARIFCGIYGESVAEGWDWLFGTFVPSADVIGTVVTPTSREYVVHARTNRGFSIISSPLTVAGAPSDADFALGARVILQWKQVLKYGIEGYDIYRKTGATYLLLYSVSNSQLTYIDNNSFQSIAASYPSADFDKLVAYTSSVSNIIAQIPYQNDPLNPTWITIPFAVKIPQNYDMSDTVLTSGQWLRWGWSGVSGNFDLRMTDGITVEGSDVLETASSGQFRADQVGLTVTVRTGDIVTETTIKSYDNANQVILTDDLPNDSDSAIIYITEGAPPHSVYVDLAHLDYVEGAAFAPNAEDISTARGIPPVTPNGTSQGGSGTGGGGIDGQPVCLFEEEFAVTNKGTLTAREIHDRFMAGERFKFADGYDGSNTLTECRLGVSDVWLIETASGAILQATDTKQIYVSKTEKRTVAQLEKGDEILTNIDGVILKSPITLKAKAFTRKVVVQFSLMPNHSFLAGHGAGFVVVDNNKPVDGTPVVT